MMVDTSNRETLESEKTRLEKQLATLQTKRPIRIGFLGTRGSGKSSLLAAWYLFRSDRRFKVDISPDEDTMAYLRSVSETLLENGSTAATPVIEPEKLRFSCTSDGIRWEIEAIDFSGEFLVPTKVDNQRRDAQSSRSFLQECDVLFCLCDPTDRSIDTINALDLVFRDSKKRCILVLTKFDETGGEIKSDAEFASRLQALESRNPVLGDLRFKVEATFAAGQHAIVPVSALGADFSSKEAPKTPPLSREDLRPFNIYQPLVKMIEFWRVELDAVDTRLRELNDQLEQLDALEHSEKVKRDAEKERLEREKLAEEKRRKEEQANEANAKATAERNDLEVRFMDLVTEYESSSPGQKAQVESYRRRVEQLMRHAKTLRLRELFDNCQLFKERIQREVRQNKIAAWGSQFDELEQEIVSGLHGSVFEWFSAPIGQWQLDLDRFEKTAYGSSTLEIQGKCSVLRSRIRIRQTMMQFLAFTACVGAIVGGIYLLIVYRN